MRIVDLSQSILNHRIGEDYRSSLRSLQAGMAKKTGSPGSSISLTKIIRDTTSQRTLLDDK